MNAAATRRVLGYVRVSTDRQDVGPEVQIDALRRAAAAGGWELELRREDAASARSLAGRPALAGALADLAAGRADMLAVSKLDRLSRSVADFAGLLERAEREGWDLACLDLGVDTSSITGRAMAHVTAAFAEMERRRISERTRDALARRRAEGVRLGRPRQLDPATDELIRAWRADGMTHHGIADRLVAERVPTATGLGRWNPGTVGRILRRPAL